MITLLILLAATCIAGLLTVGHRRAQITLSALAGSFATAMMGIGIFWVWTVQ
jgi:hypothetical protein